MSPRQAFISVLHLFSVFSFFASGIFFVALPLLPIVRMRVVDFLLIHFEKCSVIGLALLIAGFILLAGFYALDRGRYLVIRMGVFVDLDLVRQAVDECFVKQFQKKISLSEIEVSRKSRIEMRVSIDPVEESAREELFTLAEKELTLLLRERFGYAKPFQLIVKI